MARSRKPMTEAARKLLNERNARRKLLYEKKIDPVTWTVFCDWYMEGNRSDVPVNLAHPPMMFYGHATDVKKEPAAWIKFRRVTDDCVAELLKRFPYRRIRYHSYVRGVVSTPNGVVVPWEVGWACIRFVGLKAHWNATAYTDPYVRHHPAEDAWLDPLGLAGNSDGTPLAILE